MNRESLVGKELAYISGLIDAKGAIDNDQEDIINLRINVLDMSVLETITDVLSELRITYSVMSSNTKGRDSFHIIIGGENLINLLNHTYLYNQILRERLSLLLNIPISEVGTNQMAWLAGIIDSMGYVHKPKGPRSTIITIYNFNKDIWMHILEVLNRLGIHYSIKRGHVYITKAVDILKVYNQIPIQCTDSLMILETITSNLKQRQRYKYKSEYIYQLHIEGMNFTQICEFLGISTSNSGRLCKQLTREGYVIKKGINRQPRKDIQDVLPIDNLDKVYQRLVMGASARSILREYGVNTSSHRLLNQLEREGYDVKPFRRS